MESKFARPPVSKDSDQWLRGWLVADNKDTSVPHGTVLGVTLLIIIISDIDDDTKQTLNLWMTLN